MPYDPLKTQGELPAYDLQEFADTGLLVTGVSFTPRQDIKEKTGHVPGAANGSGGYGQIVQVQVYQKALDIEIKGEIVPDLNGEAVGLANVYPGEAVSTAHFAAGDTEVPSIHGFSRNAAKLLMVRDVKRELDPEKPPVVTVPLSYYPQVALAA